MSWDGLLFLRPISFFLAGGFFGSAYGSAYGLLSTISGSFGLVSIVFLSLTEEEGDAVWQQRDDHPVRLAPGCRRVWFVDTPQ